LVFYDVAIALHWHVWRDMNGGGGLGDVVEVGLPFYYSFSIHLLYHIPSRYCNVTPGLILGWVVFVQ